MKLKTIIRLHSKRKIYLSAFLLILPLYILAQSSYNVSFRNASVYEIIQTLEDSLDITFNYDNDVLSNKNRITFSVNGEKEKILNTFCSIIDMNPVELEDDLYTIQNQPISQDRKVDLHKFKCKVVDESGIIIPFCLITLKNDPVIIESNKNGEFELSGYFSDSEIMTLHYLGYKDKRINIGSLNPIKTNIIKLVSTEMILGEILITEFRKVDDVDELVDTDVLNNSDFLASGTLDNDGLQLSQILPGVYSSAESIDNLQIRGGPPDQTNLEWNNIKLFQPSLFFGKVSSINPFMTNKIKINKNGSMPREGTNASGSIVMENDLNGMETSELNFYTDMLYFNVGYGTSLFNNKFKFKVATRQSYSNLFSSPIINNYFDHSFQVGLVADRQFTIERFELEEVLEYIPSFSFGDITFSSVYNLTHNTNIEVNIIDLKSKFEYDEIDEYKDDSGYDRQLTESLGVSSNLTHRWNHNIKSKIYYQTTQFISDFYQTNYSDALDMATQKILYNEFRYTNFGTNHTFRYNNNTLKLGAQIDNYNVSFDDFSIVENIDQEGTFIDKGSKELSFFLDYQTQFTEELFLNFGYRWSKYDFTFENEPLLEPTAHLSYKPNNKWRFHFHYGQYHQNINRRYLFSPLQFNASIWYLSDETSFDNSFVYTVNNEQFSIGVNYETKNWSAQLDYYRKNISNIWSSAFEFTFEENPYVFSNSRIEGLELSNTFLFKNSKAIVSYNFMDDDLILDENNITRSPYYQPHRLNIYYQTTFKNLTLSVNWKFSNGRFYSLPADFIVEYNDMGDPEFYTDFEELFTEQMPDYHRLDLSASYRIFNKKKMRAFLAFGLINLYDKENVTQRQFLTNFNLWPDVETSLFQQEGLPFTPNLSLSIHL